MSKKLTSEERHNRCVIICSKIESGYSLRKALKEDKLSSKTFFQWVEEEKEIDGVVDKPNVKQYARACEERHTALFEEILDIADESGSDKVNGVLDSEAIQRSKLRVDARKWVLSKMNPKKYGDSSTLKHEGGETPIETISVFKLPDNKRD
jgi:hypothetical protein